MTATKHISPLGHAVADDAARDYASDAVYRAQADKLAPYRVIAETVILARGRQGITQRQLADAIGTTASAISRLESGEHPVSFETISKLGSALRITFVVGSPNGAGKDCVVIPERAVEKPRPRRAASSGGYVAPTPVFARGSLISDLA